MIIGKCKDPRLVVVRKIVTALFSPVEYRTASILLTTDNDMIINVMDTILYNIHLKELDNQPPLPTISFNFVPLWIDGSEIPLEEDEYIPVENPNIFNLYQNYVVGTSMMTPVACDNSLRSNNTFEELLSLKAADGIRFFRMLGLDMRTYYMVPIMSGFPKLNKPDTIGITIYREGGNQIVKMNIFKKKINREYQMYYRALII